MTNDMRQTLINADPAVPKFEDEYTPTQKDLKSFGILSFEKQQKICPVKAVGMMDDVFLYIDGATQFRRVKANEHSINGIRALFVPFDEMLPSLFPRYDKKGIVVGWKADDAAAFLMRACGQKGIFDPAYKERGVGCWRDKKGGLVFHCGNRVLVCRRDGGEHWFKPGEIEGYIYPGATAVPAPSENGAEEKGASEYLLNLLSQWNFIIGSDLGAFLLTGWIGAAMIGGALPWRPMVWITGKKGAGKSTLQSVIRSVFGDGGIVKAAEATEAGIRQQLKSSTLPVALDENEADEDNTKNKKMIALARIAASGDVSLRGGENHKGKIFELRSAFLFSSILVPPLEGADIDRILILDIGKNCGKAPMLDDRRLGEIGRSLRRKMILGWSRFDDVFAEAREHLFDAGVEENRMLDQFGVLIACALLLLHNASEPIPWEAPEYQNMLFRIAKHAKSVKSENEEEAESCFNYMMTSTVETWRGGQRQMVAELIEAVRKNETDIEADEILQRNGIRVFRRRVNGNNVPFLFIANRHKALNGIFEGTKWNGRGSTKGGWVGALRQGEHSFVSEVVHCGGVKLRGTVFALADLLPQGGDT